MLQKVKAGANSDAELALRLTIVLMKTEEARASETALASVLRVGAGWQGWV